MAHTGSFGQLDFKPIYQPLFGVRAYGVQLHYKPAVDPTLYVHGAREAAGFGGYCVSHQLALGSVLRAGVRAAGLYQVTAHVRRTLVGVGSLFELFLRPSECVIPQPVEILLY